MGLIFSCLLRVPFRLRVTVDSLRGARVCGVRSQPPAVLGLVPVLLCLLPCWILALVWGRLLALQRLWPGASGWGHSGLLRVGFLPGCVPPNAPCSRGPPLSQASSCRCQAGLHRWRLRAPLAALFQFSPLGSAGTAAAFSREQGFFLSFTPFLTCHGPQPRWLVPVPQETWGASWGGGCCMFCPVTPTPRSGSCRPGSPDPRGECLAALLRSGRGSVWLSGSASSWGAAHTWPPGLRPGRMRLGQDFPHFARGLRGGGQMFAGIPCHRQPSHWGHRRPATQLGDAASWTPLAPG